MPDPVVVQVTIAAPAEVVWRALREPEQLRRWHGWEYDEGAGLAGEIDEIYFSGATADDAAHRLDTGGGVFELEAHGERTVVRITRAAPTGSAGWDGVYDEINEGWLSFVQQLRYYLERHPGEDRRTLVVDRELPLPDGERWFGSEHQAGVLLDGYGLLIVMRGRTLVSTYGLGDAGFEQLRERLS